MQLKEQHQGFRLSVGGGPSSNFLPGGGDDVPTRSHASFPRARILEQGFDYPVGRELSAGVNPTIIHEQSPAESRSSLKSDDGKKEIKFCYSPIFTSASFGDSATVTDIELEEHDSDAESHSELKALVCRDSYFLQSSRCKGDRVRAVSSAFYTRLWVMTSFPCLAMYYVILSLNTLINFVQYLRFNDKYCGGAIGNAALLAAVPPLLSRLSTYSFCGDTSRKVPPLLSLLSLTPFWPIYHIAVKNKEGPSNFLRKKQGIEMGACSVYELCDSIIAFTLKKREIVKAGRMAAGDKIWAEIEAESGLFLLPYVLDLLTQISLVIHFILCLMSLFGELGPPKDFLYYVLDWLQYPVYLSGWCVVPSILSFFLFTCHCHDFAISAFKRRILLDRLKDKSDKIQPQWGAISRDVVVNYIVTAPMITEASVASLVSPHNEDILGELVKKNILKTNRRDHWHRKKKTHAVTMSNFDNPPFRQLPSPSCPQSAQSAVVVTASEIFDDVTIVLPEDVKIHSQKQAAYEREKKAANELEMLLKKIFVDSVAKALGVPWTAVKITSVVPTTGEILGSVRDFNEEYLYHQAVIRRSSESWQLIVVICLFLSVAAAAFLLAGFFILQDLWCLGLSVIFGMILIILVMRMAVLNGKLASIVTVLKEASSDDWPLYGGRGKILHDLTDNPIQFTLYGFAITYSWLLSLTTAVVTANLSVVLVIYSSALKSVDTSSAAVTQATE